MIKLRNRATGKLVNPNDVLTTFRGERVTITGWPTDGHNRVYVRDEQGRTAEYFPTVVDCELIDEPQPSELVDGPRPLLWESVPYKRDGSVFVDIPGIGRYLIQRRLPGRREFRALLNNKPTTFVGTVDQVKKMVERFVEANKLARRP